MIWKLTGRFADPQKYESVYTIFRRFATTAFSERKILYMMNNPKPISEFLVPGKRAHLVGIGGVSMAPLAEVLHGKGMTITGSDMHESHVVDHLRELGIPVTIGHWPENVRCV